MKKRVSRKQLKQLAIKINRLLHNRINRNIMLYTILERRIIYHHISPKCFYYGEDISPVFKKLNTRKIKENSKKYNPPAMRRNWLRRNLLLSFGESQF